MGYILGEPTVQQYFDANGDPLENGTIEFYVWNTSTPTAIYSDSTGTSAGTSVTLNSIGAPANGGTSIALFFDTSVIYKIVRKDSFGTAISPTIGPYYGSGGGGFFIDAVDSGASDSLYDYTGALDDQKIQVGGYYTVGDGGGGIFYWDASSSAADDGGSVILPTGHAGNGRWVRIVNSVMNIQMWGAIGDDTVDCAGPINAATNYLKGSGGTIHGGSIEGAGLYVPAGTYLLSVPIQVFSGLNFYGDGPTSVLKSSSVFVGAGIIVLTEVGGGGGQKRVDGATLNNLAFDSTATAGSQAGVTHSTTYSPDFILVNDIFKNLYFNTEKCLDLGVYCQSCIIDNIYSFGPVDQVIHLSGNNNIITNVDKEVGSGTSSDPYILFDTVGGTMSCSGNRISGILLEGEGSSNKAGIRIDGASDIKVENIWQELSASNGNAIEWVDCSGFCRMLGKYQAQIGEAISITNTLYLSIEYMNVDDGLLTLFDYMTVDDISIVEIDYLLTRKAENVTNIDRPNVKVKTATSVTASSSADPGKLVRYKGFDTSGNILKNGSFEAGAYLWEWNIPPTTTEEYIQSEIGDGLMGHFVWATNANARFSQNVVVPAEWVGRFQTLSMKVKIKGGDENATVTARIGTTGPIENFQYFPKVTGRNDDWHLLTFTFAHQSAGTSQIGFRFQIPAGVELFIDECSLTFGSEAVPNLSNTRSIQMNGRVMTTGTVAPTTGQWLAGSIVYNEAAAAGGSIGWVCTTAGSPGTWKTFGAITA